MSSRNHAFTYRPLQGGTLVINPANDRPGTLGIILSDGVDMFALSCYHVLGRADGAPFPDGEPILQSLVTKGGAQIGRIHARHSDAAMDVAAATLDPGVAASGRVLGLPELGQPLQPVPGMRVLKSGAFTGVTEGVVARVVADRVEVGRPAGYPNGFELCDFGDSGAIWVDRDTMRPVAIHTAQNQGGDAIGVRLLAVLARLGLSPAVS